MAHGILTFFYYNPWQQRLLPWIELLLASTFVSVLQLYDDKKLNWCGDSSRYDNVSHSGRSANLNRNPKYDLCKL